MARWIGWRQGLAHFSRFNNRFVASFSGAPPDSKRGS